MWRLDLDIALEFINRWCVSINAIVSHYLLYIYLRSNGTNSYLELGTTLKCPEPPPGYFRFLPITYLAPQSIHCRQDVYY
jgi:hypothetical protein